MPDDPEWMKPMDRRILEFLAETKRVKMAGLWFKPVGLARNIDATRQYVSARLQVLVDEGLIEQDEEGFYRITDKGYYHLQ